MSNQAEALDLGVVKLFGKYSWEDIEIRDPSLIPYISVTPRYLPWSGGRHEAKRLQKSKVNIVERLANRLMRKGRMGGKKANAIKIVRGAFKIIHEKTGQNPIQILVRGVENAAPAEDVTNLSYGGATYHVAVDVAPQRRVDVALRHITDGARRRAHQSPRSIEETLAEEMMNASQGDTDSFAISRRVEIERIAVSAR